MSRKRYDGNKVTCIAVGDPHFQVNNVLDAEELIVKVNKLVEQLQPTFVVILGDLLHTHEKIHITPFNLATRLITSLAHKVQVFLIIGNHDYCFAKDTPILMWDGTTQFSQDVQVGDELVGDDGIPRTVKRLIRGSAPMYTITQKKGMDYTVTGHHTLSLKCDLRKKSRWNHKLAGWVVQWLRDDCSTGMEFFLTEEEANDYLDNIPDIYTIEVTVEDYLKLPQFVRDHLFGYRTGWSGIVRDTSEITVTKHGVDDYYGWELDGNHRFLLGDLTVTHNCNNQQFLTDRHAFNSFKKIENVTVCDRVILRTINGIKFVFCPYTPPERFEEALGTLEDKGRRWDNADCIFAHQEFYGCRFNPVMTSTEGDIWPEEYPLVVSGHIHNEQRLQTNIYYTGSSMQHAFGETANKTIALLTFTRGQKFRLQKIDLEMRKKKIVYLDVEKAALFTPEENVYVKLVLQGRPEQFKVFRRGQTYRDLQKMNIAISFSPKGDTVDATRTVQKRSVLDILEEMIKKDDKYVHRAFDELKEECE